MSVATIKDAELVIQLSQLYATEKVGEGISWIWSDEFVTDYEMFIKKYPPGSENFNKFRNVCRWFELVGTIYKHKLINKEFLYDLWSPNVLWVRIGRICLGLRKTYHTPVMWANFELLALEDPNKSEE